MRNLLLAALGGALIAVTPAGAAVMLAPEPALTADATVKSIGDGSAVEAAVEQLRTQPAITVSTPRRDATRARSTKRQGETDVAELPEPATWAMMFLGFGGLSFALRRRRPPSARIRFS